MKEGQESSKRRKKKAKDQSLKRPETFGLSSQEKIPTKEEESLSSMKSMNLTPS